MNPVDLPRWDGKPLEGRTLLVRAEQGYGDCIQFARYLPLLSRYGGRILFECPDRSMESLFFSYPGIDEIVVRGEPLPSADVQIPLGSLPLIFGTDLSSIPMSNGYLKPSSLRREFWQRQIALSQGAESLRVGIVWSGRKTRLNSNRSIEFSLLEPLFRIDGIKWFSLQVGPDVEILKNGENGITDLGSQFINFSDTAACIATLDLVISIDSAVAHLAGALGAPVWVLLKMGSDWRWLIERSDSPWYTSARLFRQDKTGDWKSVVTKVVEALQHVVAERGSTL